MLDRRQFRQTRDENNCYKVNDGKFVGDSLSNAVYQVPNYAAQTYEDNKVPEGCWMEPNGNVRYNKGKSDKPCGYVSNGLPKNCIQRDVRGNAEKECTVGNCSARHQRVDADRHETPPVRQGPRRLGIQARVGNAGRLPRVQTGILLRLSRKAHILLPRRSRRADVSVCPRRQYEFQKRRVRAVGRRPGQGLLHVLEREQWQRIPSAFFTGDPARIFRTSPTACAESQGESTAATAFRP